MEMRMLFQSTLLVIAGFSICAALAAQTAPPKYDPASVARGQQAFVASCGFCHGSRGKGGEKGPDLLRSVLVLDDENGKSIGKVILNGRPDKGMPKFAMTEDKIIDIANFLHQSIYNAADRDSYQTLNIVTGDAKAGEAYFNGAGKCNSCHSVTGDLKSIATKYDPVSLQDRLLMPMDWGPSAKAVVTVTVTPTTGEPVTGPMLWIDDFTVALRTPEGKYQSFSRQTDSNPRIQIHDPFKPHSDMILHYTDAEIHNLTAYLVTLK
jgi:mono/diheme cytochrome c family protein